MSCELNAADVPRAFWFYFDAAQLLDLVRLRRLTLPERDTLWRLQGRADEPPKKLSIVFPPNLTRGLALDDKGDVATLLSRLRGRLAP